LCRLAHASPVIRGRPSVGEEILRLLLFSFDLGWDKFSDDDRDLSDNASKVSLKLWGYRIPIYFVTATLIKRYRGRNLLDKVWHKDAPSHMRR
jgi:hypothetical protein